MRCVCVRKWKNLKNTVLIWLVEPLQKKNPTSNTAKWKSVFYPGAIPRKGAGNNSKV